MLAEPEGTEQVLVNADVRIKTAISQTKQAQSVAAKHGIEVSKISAGTGGVVMSPRLKETAQRSLASCQVLAADVLAVMDRKTEEKKDPGQAAEEEREKLLKQFLAYEKEMKKEVQKEPPGGWKGAVGVGNKDISEIWKQSITFALERYLGTPPEGGWTKDSESVVDVELVETAPRKIKAICRLTPEDFDQQCLFDHRAKRLLDSDGFQKQVTHVVSQQLRGEKLLVPKDGLVLSMNKGKRNKSFAAGLPGLASPLSTEGSPARLSQTLGAAGARMSQSQSVPAIV